MPKKILIIEDEQMLKDMYERKFKQAGCEVVSANNAIKGLNLAKKEKPDLILLDILLPKQNGLYVLEQLKSSAETKKIDVVAFSNFDDPKTKRKARKLGIKDYLIKTDYTPKEIVEVIMKHFK